MEVVGLELGGLVREKPALPPRGSCINRATPGELCKACWRPHTPSSPSWAGDAPDAVLEPSLSGPESAARHVVDRARGVTDDREDADAERVA
jgi:hypothetical protein